MGTEIFRGSALAIPGIAIGQSELSLIDKFHTEASPANPSRPWRLTPAFTVKNPEEDGALNER